MNDTTSNDDELLIDRQTDYVRLCLNRPARANALNASLVDALLRETEEVFSSDARLLLIEANGPVFCGGFDLSDLDAQSDGDIVLRFLRIQLLLDRLLHAPIVTMVTAAGAVYGAGADLFAACHLRIATPDARFCMPGLQFGVVLGTRLLAHRVGEDAARELLLTSRQFAADEALRHGFATQLAVVEDWPTVLAYAVQRSQLLAPKAVRALLDATRVDSRQVDMAALVDSVTRPGFVVGLRRYRDALQSRRGG